MPAAKRPARRTSPRSGRLRQLYPADQALPPRISAGLGGARDLLRAVRQPARQARGVPARRSRRRHRCAHAPLLRSAALPHRAVRPARLRQEHAAREPRSTTRPGTWSPTSSACASTSASSAGRCSAAPGARRSRSPTRRRIPQRVTRAGAARHLPAAALGARVVLPEGGATRSSRMLWEEYLEPIPAVERGDLMQRLPPPPDQSTDPAAAGARPRAPGRSGKARPASCA